MQYIAFNGPRRIAAGELGPVVCAAKDVLDQTPHASILIFETDTSRQVEIDFRGTPEEVLARLPAPSEPETEPSAEPKAGRPKLGVVAKEVTLLPRHWDWLASQPGGASITLRKLVEEARRANAAKDAARVAQEAANRFMMILAGNFPGFEEASRALYRKDKARFEAATADWSPDVREHVRYLADAAGWEA
jgi:hypothetical protein